MFMRLANGSAVSSGDENRDSAEAQPRPPGIIITASSNVETIVSLVGNA